MTNSSAMNANRKRETSRSPSPDDNAAVPSGFILKLFQMVNGAPDEVISWTPDGDAFVIGSDLNRLESETLPQYFRHNRFQSLVRQLNFYSFRKVNRERNVWIYKHELFHRDRPEDLHMVRRRTCPGVDGRKQRFSRVPARRLSEKRNEPSDTDDSSLEENSSGDEGWTDIPAPPPPPPPPARKRRNAVEELAEKEPNPKRARRLPTAASRKAERQSDDIVVDTSMIATPVSASSTDRANDSEEEDDRSAKRSGSSDRLEMIEQSMIVSEVASKLEEYARKAARGRGFSRSRRGGSGVVTPPFGVFSKHASAEGLLTYDDEFEGIARAERRSSAATAVITDGDDSTTSEDEGQSVRKSGSTKKAPKEMFHVAPVADMGTARAITELILTCGEVPAAVAGFCMTTAPNNEQELCNKILRLIATCENLAYEFEEYRAALHPLDFSVEHPFSLAPNFGSDRAMLARKIWQHPASRSDAVRLFKTFAVNLIHKLLGKGPMAVSLAVLSESERMALEYTADIWLKSIGRVMA